MSGKLESNLCYRVYGWRHLVKATEVTTGLAKNNGSLPPGGWLNVTYGLTACTPGSAPSPTLSNEYWRTLPFTFYLVTTCRVGQNRINVHAGCMVGITLDCSWTLLFASSSVDTVLSACVKTARQLNGPNSDLVARTVADTEQWPSPAGDVVLVVTLIVLDASLKVRVTLSLI